MVAPKVSDQRALWWTCLPGSGGVRWSAMIEKVEFRNFKALRDVSLDLERFTVLVGPNASGKTSVLEGLYYLSEFGQKRPENWTQPNRLPLCLRSAGADNDMTLRGSGEPGTLSLTLGTQRASFSAWSREGEPLGSTSSSSSGEMHDGDDSVVASDVCAAVDFGPAAFLRLYANCLAAAAYSDEPVPRVASDGHGLPCVLAYMASNQPATYEKIQLALRAVVPTVQRMRFPRTKVVREQTEVIKVDGKEFTRRAEREYWGNSIEFDLDGAPRIPARMVSEGTLLVLGLLTVILGPHHPKLVLLDDLDRALHPKAQKSVVEVLRTLLQQHSDMQIVATSHSPYLLDHLRPEEVRLTTLRDDGSAAVGRLDQHPEFERWREEMTPGEFWSVVGEKWLVEAGGKRQ